MISLSKIKSKFWRIAKIFFASIFFSNDFLNHNALWMFNVVICESQFNWTRIYEIYSDIFNLIWKTTNLRKSFLISWRVLSFYQNSLFFAFALKFHFKLNFVNKLEAGWDFPKKFKISSGLTIFQLYAKHWILSLIQRSLPAHFEEKLKWQG